MGSATIYLQFFKPTYQQCRKWWLTPLICIEHELQDRIGEIGSLNMLGFDQVEFAAAAVKFSFYVSNNYCPVSEPVPYMSNIRLADVYSIMAMKLELMLRRMKISVN